MEKPILISRRACNCITLGLAAIALLFPLLLPSGRGSLFHYFATAVETAFVAGFLAATATGRYLTSRLKVRMPEWRREIEKFGFGRFFRSRGPKHEGQMLSFLKKDPFFEQIQAERRMAQHYAAAWVYPAMVLVVVIILWMAVQS